MTIKSNKEKEKMKMRITPAALNALANNDIGNFLAASTPGGIEAQEKRGQQTLVNSDILPIRCPKNELIKMGIKFLKPFDDIFVNVILPTGWKKVPTEHDMWSDLVDDKGRKRASIFYKAAFYDRSSHMGLTRRFSIATNWEIYDKNEFQVFVKDCDKIVYTTPKVKFPKKYDDEYNRIEKEQKTDVINWLIKNYPNWEDPLAYWD